jgi:hypothetical protein
VLQLLLISPSQASFGNDNAGTFEIELGLFEKILFDREVSKMKFVHGLSVVRGFGDCHQAGAVSQDVGCLK